MQLATAVRLDASMRRRVGLRVGPSFVNSLGGDGLKFTLLAIVSCVIGLSLVVLGVNILDLPPGTAGGSKNSMSFGLEPGQPPSM